MKEFQKQVRKIIEERGYTLPKELSPLFDGKESRINEEIWSKWEKYPAAKVANVIVELKKIIPIHEEFMDWTGDGEEYSPPDPGMFKNYDEVIKAIEHLSGLLSAFADEHVLLQDAMLGHMTMSKTPDRSLLSVGYKLRELKQILSKNKLFFEVAKHGRRRRLPYHKGEERIYTTMKMEAARRIAELQKAILGKSLFEVATSVASIFVAPEKGEDVFSDSLKVIVHRKKT